MEKYVKDQYYMLAASMIAKLKIGGSSGSNLNGAHLLANNPILEFFDVGKQSCSAGPELSWKVFDARKKSDGKEASIFVFEKRFSDRVIRGRRKDSGTEIMKRSVKHLEVYRQPKLILVLYHGIEESYDTLAFATEPVIASLANIMAYQMATSPVEGEPGTLATGTIIAGQPSCSVPENLYPQIPMPSHAIEYRFIDFEIKYGLRQIAEALDFLSPQVYHHNICPNSVLVTKLGNWKLSGLEFIINAEPNDRAACVPWTSRVTKVGQPELDYVAPEVQRGFCGSYSDIYSLGLLIFTIFNRGHPIFQARHSNSFYQKQLLTLHERIREVICRLPMQIQDMVVMMLSCNINERPSIKTLLNTPYFSERHVETLQYLDVMSGKDSAQKTQYYKDMLPDALPYLPKKIWFQRVWPFLQAEINSTEYLAAVLTPIVYMIHQCTDEEYERIILPDFRKLFHRHRSVQATVTLLENLHIILNKTPKDDIRKEVLPILYRGFESPSIQIQGASLIAVTNSADYLEDVAIRRMVVPKMKLIYEENSNDDKMLSNILCCIERIVDKLDRQQITDEVLPLMWDFKLQQTEVINKTVDIYRVLLCDKKYGLTVNLLANQVMPSLLPNTVNPHLEVEGFTGLMEILQEMLETIDRQQLNVLKLENATEHSPERRHLRHLYSSDNMHVPQFNIPNLRVEQRKTSSAEDMQRKNSVGNRTWWFGISPCSPDSNLLKVITGFPRRLSDNTLITPKIKVAPSCASSPGGSGGATNASGLPVRRHSSIGPQERRGSTINSSPPTGLRQYSNASSRNGSTLSVPSPSVARAMASSSAPNTSTSSPYLWSPSIGGAHGRGRRPSIMVAAPSTSSSISGQSAGSALLQQINSGLGRSALARRTSISKQTYSPSHNK